jgi:chitodextrinase
VFAVDRAGNTSLAGIAAGVTARDQLAPAQPTGLSAAPGDASVGLQWAAAGPDDDVAGYVLVAKQGTQAPASEIDGTRVCPALGATSTSCVATGLSNGATYTFGLFALDEALNRSQPALVSGAPNGKVTDAKGPAAVSKLKAKVSGHKVTLTWKNPADKDFDHVEITAGQLKPAALKASKRVYSGKGSKATTSIAAGQSRWFVVVAYDAVGNASEPASVHVVIPAGSKFAPAPKAKVHGKVRLAWPLAKGARYYNVQVFAGKKRILVSWPAGRALQLPKAKLKRGTTYTWYVWPGLGTKAKAHYGKLIGKNAFTFTG